MRAIFVSKATPGETLREFFRIEDDKMRVDHVTINVRDMEKSIVLYGDILGLKKLEQVDMGDHVIQYFDLENCLLELISYKFETDLHEGAVTERGKYRHLALVAENPEEICSKIESCGIAKVLTKVSFCKNLNFDGFLFEDCNGVEVEVLKRRGY